VIDYEKLQARKPGCFNVITVPEVKLPVKDDGKIQYLFPVFTARERAAAEFKPLDLDNLDFPSLEEQVMALEDEDDVAILELADDFLTPSVKTRAIKVTVERILRLGKTLGCGGCAGERVRHTDPCHERFAKLIKEEEEHKKSIEEIKDKLADTSAASFSCDVCQSMFPSRNALFKHLKEEHPNPSSSSSSKPTTKASGMINTANNNMFCDECFERSSACICSGPSKMTSRAAGLICTANSEFCNECFERSTTCMCEEKTTIKQTTKCAGVPARISCCCLTPILQGESAVEHMSDEECFTKAPALPATAAHANLPPPRFRAETCLH
jgi:hypothetical protein